MVLTDFVPQQGLNLVSQGSKLGKNTLNPCCRWKILKYKQNDLICTNMDGLQPKNWYRAYFETWPWYPLPLFWRIERKKRAKKMTEVKKKQAKIGPFSKFRQFRSIVKIHVWRENTLSDARKTHLRTSKFQIFPCGGLPRGERPPLDPACHCVDIAWM